MRAAARRWSACALSIPVDAHDSAPLAATIAAAALPRAARAAVATTRWTSARSTHAWSRVRKAAALGRAAPSIAPSPTPPFPLTLAPSTALGALDATTPSVTACSAAAACTAFSALRFGSGTLRNSSVR